MNSFSFLNFSLTIEIIKAPKHLLNAIEVAICRNGVEMYHIKILNDHSILNISYSSQIFKQNPLFFRTMLIKQRHYFILKSSLPIVFLSLIKSQVSTLVSQSIQQLRKLKNDYQSKHSEIRYNQNATLEKTIQTDLGPLEPLQVSWIHQCERQGEQYKVCIYIAIVK